MAKNITAYFHGFDGDREVALHFVDRNGKPYPFTPDGVIVNKDNRITLMSGPGCMIAYDRGKYENGADIKDVYKNVLETRFSHDVFGREKNGYTELWQIVYVTVETNPDYL